MNATGLSLIDCTITSCSNTQGAVQVVILPKHLPKGSAAPINLEFKGRPDSFFRSNSVVSVQKTQSGSNQSTTSWWQVTAMNFFLERRTALLIEKAVTLFLGAIIFAVIDLFGVSI